MVAAGLDNLSVPNEIAAAEATPTPPSEDAETGSCSPSHERVVALTGYSRQQLRFDVQLLRVLACIHDAELDVGKLQTYIAVGKGRTHDFKLLGRSRLPLV